MIEDGGGCVWVQLEESNSAEGFNALRIVSEFFPGVASVKNQVFFELFRDSGIRTFPGDYCRPHQPFQMGGRVANVFSLKVTPQLGESRLVALQAAEARAPAVLCWGMFFCVFV